MRLQKMNVCLACASAILCLFAWRAAGQSLDARVQELSARASSDFDRPFPPQPRALEFAQGRVFVAYPGAPGMQIDVFTENFITLERDFRVNKTKLVYRDSRGVQARYGSGEKTLAGFMQPPGTALYDDRERIPAGLGCGLSPRSYGFVVAQEASFLRSLAAEFQQPLVVFCHSRSCLTVLHAVLAANYAGPPGPAPVDAFFFLQGEPPRAIGDAVSMLNHELARIGAGVSDSLPACGIARPIRPSQAELNGARSFFVADGGTSRNSYRPSGYGRYLGPLQTAHIDAVVSSQRSKRPASFRRALTHALMEEAVK